MKKFRRWLSLVAFASVITIAASSDALVARGVVRPAARVVDANGRTLDLGSIQGRPTLVVYEDKRSATLNTQLKAELSRLARGERYRSAVALVPVADVRDYDFWPARGFVKDAIRSESKKIGATIYCDWDGSFGRTFGIQHGTSTVILIGKNGRVLHAQEGKLSPADTKQVLDLLRGEIDGSSS